MRRIVHPAFALLSLLLAAASCGGSGEAPLPTSPTPSPPSGPTDPCAVALGATSEPRAVVPRKAVGPDLGPSPLDLVWRHETARRRGWLAAAGPRPLAADVGEIAVLQDEGDLVIPANPFDLAGRGLAFRPSAVGGYDVASADATFRDDLGARLSLLDDDSEEEPFQFPFTFYGAAYQTVSVNSDGNLTFGGGDTETTARGVSRFLRGAPRLAPFFADLDPSAGGGIFVMADQNRFTVTWCAVPGFDSTDTTTVQVTLLPDGSVEFRYGTRVTLGDAVVGVSPGATPAYSPLDLSSGGRGSGSTGAEAPAAVGELFVARADLDFVAVGEKFYATHDDRFDQFVIWTDASYATDEAFAFEVTVANRIQGIGVGPLDLSAAFGSGGQLSSVVMMDRLGKYPDAPTQPIQAGLTTLSLLAHESGHRWLAFLRFLDHDREASDALLGRQSAHWSFFMDTDASVMEGNDIEALGGGAFRTGERFQRFSLLDQYAMGLVSEFDVPPFFYVESPVNVSGGQDRESTPEPGVTFNGTRRDVLMADVIAVMGPRVPSVADAPKVHRQAFVYVVGAGRSADAAAIDRIDGIRRAWEPFFAQVTDGRMRVETRLK